MREHGEDGAGESYRNEVPRRVSTPAVSRIWLPITRGRIWGMVFAFGVAVFLFSLALDLFLIHQERLQPTTAATVLDLVFGATAAVVLHRVLIHDREKCMRMTERLETIDEMNHHIRNALQVISFNAHGGSTDFEIAEIKSAVNRIQWALKEVLPKVEPEFTGFEGSARDQSEKKQRPKDGG